MKIFISEWGMLILWLVVGVVMIFGGKLIQDPDWFGMGFTEIEGVKYGAFGVGFGIALIVLGISANVVTEIPRELQK